MKPMLLRSVAADDVDTLLASPSWVTQPKMDGVRRLVKVVDGHPEWTVGRDGKAIDVDWGNRFAGIGGTWIFDGEGLFGSKFVIFDAPVTPATGVDHGFAARYQALLQLDLPNLAPIACDSEKITMLEKYREQGGEGVVFRHAAGEYIAGGRSTTALKLKFVTSCEAVVTAVGHGGKESLTLGLWDGDRMVEVGHTTRLAGTARQAKVGSVVEVQYLGVSKTRRLIQPAKAWLRSDKDASECLIDQLGVF